MEALHELRSLLTRHAADGLNPAALPGLATARADRPTEPTQAVYEPAVCFVVQGAKRTLLADRVFDYRAGDYLVVSADLPVSGHVTEAAPDAPYLCLVLALDPAVVADVLLELPATAPPSAPTGGFAVRRADAALLDAVLRLARLLDRPADAPVLARLIVREIVYRLLQGESGEMVRQIGMAESRLSQVNRASRWIRANYAEPLRVEQLARLAGMSVPSFHRHFKAVTAMSPLQYQKQVRLQQARGLLLSGGGEVAGVGFAVGYDSPSQFSREYRRLFGAPPGRDAQRLRTDPAAAAAIG